MTSSTVPGVGEIKDLITVVKSNKNKMFQLMEIVGSAIFPLTHEY